ncbi:hypothetical protein Ahy_B09g095315 isoform C [Arachis hypogaea]|uniref:MYB transcription factor n=1 Tax=Arachis hypogaea TaxID=3818 RepID=A0A444XDF5_ARAHY|nr:hypothetical protein Ahy_B09g095315 isoform C [Arachis hypogaea]
MKQETLASPPPPQGLPPSVALRHYRRLVFRASSSFKNRSFFFLELDASVPGIHLLLPPSVGRSVTIVFVWSSQILPTHHCLMSCVRRLASVSVTILPPSSQIAQKENPSPFQFPSFEFTEQKLNQEKNLRLRRLVCEINPQVDQQVLDSSSVSNLISKSWLPPQLWRKLLTGITELKNSRKKTKKMGNQKQKWTQDEEDALIAGVEKHGPGKWKNILKDPQFAPFLTSRSNIDLKVQNSPD